MQGSCFREACGSSSSSRSVGESSQTGLQGLVEREKRRLRWQVSDDIRAWSTHGGLPPGPEPARFQRRRGTLTSGNEPR